MNFTVGDLIISKNNRNKKEVGYITKIHKPDTTGWFSESITIQYDRDVWTRLSVTYIEQQLNTNVKLTRWYHYGVIQ